MDRAYARVTGSSPVVLIGRSLARLGQRPFNAQRALPSSVLGPVLSPPWFGHRRFPPTALRIHALPWRVLAPHMTRPRLEPPRMRGVSSVV